MVAERRDLRGQSNRLALWGVPLPVPWPDGVPGRSIMMNLRKNSIAT